MSGAGRLRTIRIEAPRGYILDRNGRVIVANVPGTAVKLWVGDLPKQGRYDLIRRLAAVLDVAPARLAREVDERRSDPYAKRLWRATLAASDCCASSVFAAQILRA